MTALLDGPRARLPWTERRAQQLVDALRDEFDALELLDVLLAAVEIAAVATPITISISVDEAA